MSEEETSQEAQVDDEEVDDANEIILPTSDQVHTEVTEDTQPTGDKNEEGKKDEKTEEERDLNRIPSDFFYDLEPLLCTPFKSESCPLTSSVLTLYHSFGYNCLMRCNLHVLDKNTLVFAAGAVLQFVNLTTLTYSYLRTTGGGSVGPIAVHPSGKLFAVGEKGKNPVINIFSIPDIRLYRILKGGALKTFSSLCFEEAGDLLASQGGEPNYMLTIWNWAQEAILLRCKAFSQEVYHAAFNPSLQGYLITCGSSHIKFWRMARTFTGLKLQGVVGRFGRTSISDIEGFLQFPDGKVLSGSEWGNMLLWEESLIKLQVCRKQSKPCHQSQIYQMILDEGEIITAGLDGYVRSWSLEHIDQAEVDEESAIIEMEPLNEVLIGRNVQIMYLSTYIDLESRETTVEDQDSSSKEAQSFKMDDPKRKQPWYLQDRAGAIWQAELSFLNDAAEPKRLLSFHSGPIVACAVSPITYLAATLGVDGTVRLYDFLSKEVLAFKSFKSSGVCLVWVPLSVNNKCNSVVAGFADGAIRVLTVEIMNQGYLNKATVDCELLLAQALKPHNKPVTSLAFNTKGQMLATCSEDKTIFLFFVKQERYTPFCFLPLPYLPRHLHWVDEDDNDLRMRVVCDEGVALCVTSPQIWEVDTKDTLRYEGATITQFKFMSIKSKIIHEAEEEKKRKEEEKKKRAQEEKDRKRIEDGLETQSQQNLRKEIEALELAESMGMKRIIKEPEWEPYIPPLPSPILQAVQCDNSSNFWVSMGGYDVGYFYECQFPEGACSVVGSPERCEPVRAVAVPLTEDVPITCVRFNSDGTCVFYGFQDGHIRVVFLEGEFDLTSQDCFCVVSAHDMTTGAITGIELSHDEMFLLTIGADGNFFVFSIVPLDQLKEEIKANRAKLPSAAGGQFLIQDLEPDHYTIEDAKQKADYDELVRLAEKSKQDKRGQINALRIKFQQLLRDNEALPPHLRLNKKEFVMSEERELETKQEILAKEAEMKRQMAWECEKLRIGYEKVLNFYRSTLLQETFEVKAFLSDHTISSYRMNDDRSTAELMSAMERAERAMAENKPAYEWNVTSLTSEKGSETTVKKEEEEEEEEDMSRWAGANTRVLAKLKKAKIKREKRALRREVWRKFIESKPGDDYEDPEDVKAIQVARETLGDFPLKTDPNYKVPESYKLTVMAGNRRLASCLTRLKDLQIQFNQKLLALRERKKKIVSETQALHEQLSSVQEMLPLDKHLPTPPLVSLSVEEEPEKRMTYSKFSLRRFQSQKLNTTGLDVPAAVLPAVKETRSKSRRRTGTSSEESDDLSSSDDLVDLSSVMLEPAPSSPLEKQIEQEKQIHLEYTQRKLIEDITAKMAHFDVSHRLLHHDKVLLDVTLKVAELRVNTLLEENIKLKQCEDVEFEILRQTNVAMVQKLELDKLQKQLLEVLDKKNKEMEKFVKLEKVLFTKMEEVVGEHNPFRDYLVKVFKKKIKRKKKKRASGQGGQDEDQNQEEEEESESSSESSSEGEDDDDEEEEEGTTLDLNVCPNDCSRELFDSVVALREERLDLEDLKMEAKSGRDATLKELDNVKRKSSSNTHEIEKQKRAFQEFQVEKQTRLNDIHVLAFLHPHQLKCLEAKKLPATLDNELVINEEDVDRLRKRIEELKKEKKIQRQNMQDSRRHFHHLQYELKHHHKHLQAMIEKCDKAMMDKLGRLVDMEVLDLVVADPELESLRCILDMNKIKCNLEMIQMNRDISDLRQQRLNSVRMDTERKNVLSTSLTKYNTVTEALDIVQKSELPYADDTVVPPMTEDIENFQFLVAQQQLLIRSLHQELEVLRHSVQPPSSDHLHSQF
ncbi:cilia- and flagella-associated protein 44-like isoform X2 [Pomacea canaliculata]|uniref:cilia- and flagella-associated protein 44-like isoform X2 n=1 Tax=Pomacea canaliculata TaxID=400727 RepID=UPI000D73441D|nr:cilia- and flagella-associated protein 44-like isoform X2 [Pomacea canaliculata]